MPGIDLSRRQLMALSSGLLVPRHLLAAPPAAGDRMLLTIFCAGGWDQTAVFAPLFHSSHVDMEPDAVEASAGGITFVDHPDRPSVPAFFEAWGDKTCLINGLEVQAIAHESCTRILMTGRNGVGGDDWSSIIAGHAPDDPLMPHIVVSGPAFADAHVSRVVRVGAVGQLPDLVTGAALDSADLPVAAPSAVASAAIDDFLASRAARFAAGAPPGQAARFADRYATALDQAVQAAGYAESLAIDTGEARDLVDQLELALTCFELGLSRTATVQYDGIWAAGWDTHADNWYQSMHFEELFGYLDRLMTTLSTRTAPDGAPLSERVTIAVVSEMGRNPKLNGWDGRHHWTYTSAMLLGAGVAGGQVIGGYDELSLGRPTDLSAGAVSDAGEWLVSAHLGATLLALADVDPGPYLGAPPITAALS